MRTQINRHPLFLLCLLVGLAAPLRIHAGTPAPLAGSRQMVVVTTPGWNDVAGTLQKYERANPRGKWTAVGKPFAVVVGKNGLGWGTGIAPVPSQAQDASDPVKKEGDGKAPAGVFKLRTAFGYAPERLPGSRMPYVSLTPSVECVDDTHSTFYNRVLDRGTVAADWNSSEHMLRTDELYRWGVVVDHNSDPPAPGAGSCIFLHIWRGPGQGTVGCTAMPREQIESLLGWLDPEQAPLLVQLPAEQYKRLRSRWKLPRLAASH